MKRKYGFLGLLVILGGCLLVGKVSAASLAGFNAGNIISDAQMTDYNSMSEGDIQAFLNAKNSCGNRDYNYYLALSSNRGYSWHWADGHFVCLSQERFGNSDNEIGWGETAAHIIWQAAQDYKINPKVLIVTLQKESSLVTDPIPNNRDYRTAMGFGCPDTAACSSQYYGFRNQIRGAAALYRTVMDGGWSSYPVGDNYIRYSPNAACGGTVVNVQNRATSALYRYTPYQPNAAALSWGGDGCSTYGNRNFYSYFQDWFGNIGGGASGGSGSSGSSAVSVSMEEALTHNRLGGWGTDYNLEYQSHVENLGWMPWTGNGEMSGTAGYALRMEALAVKLKNATGIEYRAHVEDVGWMNYVRDGEVTGTTGRSLRMEAVQIRLTGNMAKLYDVYYRSHLEGYGWTDWVKNDQVSGTTGQARRLEAIQVFLKKKDSGAGPEYVAHVEDKGWMGWTSSGREAGTTGQSKRLEAVQIKLPSGVSGSINYQAHVEDIGWMGWVQNGAVAGTTGQSRRLEAIQINLSGEVAKRYDVYYRAHTEGFGWMGWVKNGEVAGTTGQSRRLEALQIELVRK